MKSFERPLPPPAATISTATTAHCDPGQSRDAFYQQESEMTAKWKNCASRVHDTWHNDASPPIPPSFFVSDEANVPPELPPCTFPPLYGEWSPHHDYNSWEGGSAPPLTFGSPPRSGSHQCSRGHEKRDLLNTFNRQMSFGIKGGDNEEEVPCSPDMRSWGSPAGSHFGPTARPSSLSRLAAPHYESHDELEVAVRRGQSEVFGRRPEGDSRSVLKQCNLRVAPRSVFVGNIPPGVSHDQLHALMSRQGAVSSVNCDFRAGGSWLTAFVTYMQPTSAAKAVEFFHGRRAIKAAPPHRLVCCFAPPPPPSICSSPTAPPTLSSGVEGTHNAHPPVISETDFVPKPLIPFFPEYGLLDHRLMQQNGQASHRHRGWGGSERDPTKFSLLKDGPPGANLFVYGIPSDWTEVTLLQLFQEFGHVVGIRVPDAFSPGPRFVNKGFGFVSYSSVGSSERALRCLNGAQYCGKVLSIQLKVGEQLPPSRMALSRGASSGGWNGASSVSDVATESQKSPCDHTLTPSCSAEGYRELFARRTAQDGVPFFIPNPTSPPHNQPREIRSYTTDCLTREGRSCSGWSLEDYSDRLRALSSGAAPFRMREEEASSFDASELLSSMLKYALQNGESAAAVAAGEARECLLDLSSRKTTSGDYTATTRDTEGSLTLLGPVLEAGDARARCGSIDLDNSDDVRIVSNFTRLLQKWGPSPPSSLFP